MFRPAVAPSPQPRLAPDRAEGANWTGHRKTITSRATHLVVFLAIGLVTAACGASEEPDLVARAGDLGHIHDVALDDDGVLLVASHTGLYRVEGPTRAVRIGQHHDLMSMTRLPGGDLLSSGHPNLLLEEFMVEDRPPFFGLARSTDGGKNWDELDLLGEADFHALVPDDDGGLYAAEASGRIWFQNKEGGWTQLGEVDARDLAIDPASADRQLAPDYDGMVWLSSDGATTWTVASNAPPLIEIEWPKPDTIVGATEGGIIWLAAAPDGPWTEVATGPTQVETFYVDTDLGWWLTVEGGAISHSSDDGATWQSVYIPPDTP